MSARDKVADLLWLSVPSTDNDQAKRTAERMLDAYRDEVLADAAVTIRAAAPKHLDNDVDVHVWHVLDTLADKIARGES